MPLAMSRKVSAAWAVGLLLVVLTCVGWYAVQPAVMFYSMLGLLLLGVAAALMDFRRHVVLLFYLLAFLTFIFGRMVVVEIFGYRDDEPHLMGTYATDAEMLVTTLAIYFLFLTALLVAYWASRTVWPSPPHGADQQGGPWRTAAFARGALIAFYALLVPYLVYLGMVGQFVATEGYYAYHQDRSAAAPGFLRFFDDAMVLAFIVYLATRPRLRDLRIHGVVFLLARLGALVTMERNAAVLPILMLAAYAIAHTPRSWAARLAPGRVATVIGSGVVAILGALWVLTRMNAARGTGGQSVGLVEAPLELLYGQGYTINIAILSQRLADSLPDSALYSLGPVIEFVQSRILHPITGDYGYLFSSNAQRAAEGHQLSHSLSYAWMGEHYVQGAGVGSSAPVELWLDFGFIGVALGGVLTGALLSLLGRWLTGGFWQVVVTLVLVQGLWFSPRGSFSEFLVTISVRTMAAAVLLALFLYVYTRYVGRSDRRPATVDAP